MSAINLVARAILDSDEPLSSAELIEQTGETAPAVYSALCLLKNRGLIKSESGKKSAVDAEKLAEVANGASAAPGRATGAPPRKKRRRKSNGATRAAPKKESSFTFFVDEDGDIQIIDGDEPACIVPCADALRLYAFLERVKPLLES